MQIYLKGDSALRTVTLSAEAKLTRIFGEKAPVRSFVRSFLVWIYLYKNASDRWGIRVCE